MGIDFQSRPVTPELDTVACQIRNEPPLYPHCGGLARPNVMMFGDWGWTSVLVEQQRRRELHWRNMVDEALGTVAIVEIGAGTAITSVRYFCHELIRQRGARLVRINPREFDVPSTSHVGIPLGSLEALERIDAYI